MHQRNRFSGFPAAFGIVAALLLVIPVLAQAQANQLPVLNPIGDKTIDEGVNLNFGVSATDAESIPALTTSSLPTGATFVDNLDGTATFDWTPTFTQAGIYPVMFYATDDSAAVDSELVTITVNDINQPPVLAAIGAKSVNENVNLNFNTTANDPDVTTPSMSATGLPLGATFTDNLNGTGTFNWTPTYDQSGVYNVTFFASDGTLKDSEIVAITVNNVNRDPVLAAIGARSVNENVNLNFNTTATDPDGTTPSMSATGLPVGATFVDNLNGTGTFNWTPTYTQSGIYNITFFASDGTLKDSEIVAITVNNVNREPVLAAIGAR
ncbi:MAG: Ig-like domain-containing protein, partial [candidate division Zixibacteria bacterium]|nr:Ig-like domain-containing protein [candidate division Zixibacteria bacterium]